MPKKSKDGGESKKSRRTSSSTKEARASSATSPSSSDALLPPTPSATHLIASNPFDEPPSANNMNAPGSMPFGPSHFPMHSPIHSAGMGSPNSMQLGSPWGSNSMGSHRGMRPYGSPGPPNWNPNTGELMSPNNSHMIPSYQGIPMHQQQGMSPTGYNYNRPMMNHPGLGGNPHQVSYHGPPRMPANRFGEMSPERMQVPRMPMHMHGMSPGHGNMPMAAANQMKILTRPMGPIPQTPTPTNSHSGRKSSSSSKSELKFSRSDGGSTPKSKKKSKSSESKSASKLNDADDKGGKANLSRSNSKTHIPSPGSSGMTPPHKIPPVLPQACAQCRLDISLEDCVCCLASCNTWYHRSCTGLTAEAFECLRSEELALWACDNCIHTKEINSVRLRDQVHSDNNLPIVGKA